MEDDMSEIAFYFEAHESYSLTSADSKEDLSMLKDTNKTRAQEQWEKIRYSVPFLLRMKSEAVRAITIVILAYRFTVCHIYVGQGCRCLC